MEPIEAILEQELEGAVDIKDKKFLRRYIALTMRSFVMRDDYMNEVGLLRSDIQVLAETMKQGFERMDKRFEAVDKRFDDMHKRFDDVNKRFGDVNNRFGDTNKRFEAVDKRFDDMNKRFDDMNKRFVMMFSFITIGFVVLSTLVTLYRFLG